MYIVIFRAKVRQLDAEYSATTKRMHELALSEFGCIEFHAVTEHDQEVALSYWPDLASIHAWRMHPEHRMAQQLGKEKWYAAYSVEVTKVERAYKG